MDESSREAPGSAVLRPASTWLAEVERLAGIGTWEIHLQPADVSWSRELFRLLDIGPDQVPTFELLVDQLHPDDREQTRAAMEATAAGGAPFEVDSRIERADGTSRWLRHRGRLERDGAGMPERLLGTVQDITDAMSNADALLHSSFHDPLSGLPNRRLFLDRVGQALHRLARQASVVSVICLDIDRFKVVNDTLGQEVGDELLAAVATRLAGLLRPEDSLARTAGDEFVVLCEGLSGEAEAVGVAERIRTSMSEPLRWQGGELVLSLSAGVALSSSASDSPQALLDDAQAAMVRAKNEGRARSAVFAETMRSRLVGRLETETELRQSIIDGDLRLYYQPIVSLADGQILGHEALVRWQHPTRGMVPPDEFIPVAEESGLILPLGAWVLQEACRQARRFQDRAPQWSRLTMSINVSGRQMQQPDLNDLVAAALADADVLPELVQLEMTESVLMDDAAATITVLERLKGLGVRLGIDDFGTGFSSLAYLRRFPVDVLKIDREFVSGLGDNLEDGAIVAAIASLADTLGLSTIAEGVETALQRDALIGLGCTRAQGYFFARPVPATEAEALLDSAEVVPVPAHA